MSEITINSRKIGSKYQPFVIVEIGINHNGSYKKAIKMVDDAYKAGAECVKFQDHIIEDEMISEAKNVIPGNANESIWNIMKKATLTDQEVIDLKKYVESKGMLYLSTPFSRASADRLNKLGVKAFKIGSGECNNYPLVSHIASFGKPIILSTGMNNIKSVAKAVKILRDSKIKYVLMQCTSIYPTPYEKVNLGAISDLKEAFPDAVLGLSDHSLGIYTCLGAVSLGASVFEKHFTSNKNWNGPDVAISIDPLELKQLIEGTAAIHNALGGKKEILTEEQPTIDFAYACVVTTKNLKVGDKLTKDNIWVKRPGTGEIKAVEYDKLLGKKVKKDINNNTQLKWSDIS